MTLLAPVPLRRGRARRLSRPALLGLLAGCTGLGLAIGLALALFSSTRDATSTFSTREIFAGERTTPAFAVSDVSSGAAVNGSSTSAFAADSRSLSTSNWSTAFASDRYVDLDFNAPLPGATPVSGMSFSFTFASGLAGESTCFYVEIRAASSGSVLATYGSSGSPLGCVTGTGLTTVATSIPAVTTADVANDLRIRVFGRNSGNGMMTIDRATVDGTGPYASFALYAVQVADAADTTPETTRWSLAGP